MKFGPSRVINASDSKKIYKKSVDDFSEVLNDGGIHVGDDLKSVYNAGQFIFSEISNLRLEVSRLGVMVRLNNSNSPGALRAYHSHIYSLLIPCSVIVADILWTKIDKLWLTTRNEIEEYENQTKVIQNKKIPNSLITKLDKLYRIALLLGQKSGLGIQTERVLDLDKAIESAIIG
jgi:hypothetical protein